ncbi:MAG: hypothetical protein H7644_11175 [Candidatus Heimdallarchaeota archaeon]|nr:hypothetical protein [Candidatus Heimdallarchaeota archaeon]MCK5144320.1 hypothetical protein [Candidatus Heimdallarchaeota archaeon]
MPNITKKGKLIIYMIGQLSLAKAFQAVNAEEITVIKKKKIIQLNFREDVFIKASFSFEYFSFS